MDRLLQLEVFSRTAELGSLSKAAEILRMSNAAASRHLSALEERLAVRLIERNTRRQWLTEAGQELLQRCSTLLNELAEAEDAVSDRPLSPKGMLRVTHKEGSLDVHAGQAVITNKGEWVRYSTPLDEGAEYIAVCLPAFAPGTVHRDE